MPTLNRQGRNHIQAGVLALACVVLGACTSQISPQYMPQGLLKDEGSSGRALVVTVVDRSTPPPAPAGGFELFHHNKGGEQLVCAACAYQLESSPAEIVGLVVTSAVTRKGVVLRSDATRKMEVQILQFAFVQSKRNSGVGLQFQANVELRVVVTDHDVVIADRSHLETNILTPGSVAFTGDIEEWVARTVSLSVESVLAAPNVSEAWKGR